MKNFFRCLEIIEDNLVEANDRKKEGEDVVEILKSDRELNILNLHRFLEAVLKDKQMAEQNTVFNAARFCMENLFDEYQKQEL